MHPFHRLAFITMSLLCLWTVPLDAQNSPSESSEWERDITAFLSTYEKTFNEHNADQLGQLWIPEGVFIDRIANVKVIGRQSLVDAFKSTFTSMPDIILQIDVNSTQKLTDSLVSIEGTLRTFEPDQTPQGNDFSAVVVKVDNAWKLASADEIATSSSQAPADHLQQLQWLVGNWTANLNAQQSAIKDLGDVTIETTYRFSPNAAFLIRSFSVTQPTADQPVLQGTQIIGWDPRAQQIRSWNFSSDGAFGEAWWSKSGQDWLIKSTQTLADGGVASGTYILTGLDEDQLQLSLIGQTINGEPLPQADPVILTRTSEQTPMDPVRADGQ